MPKKIVQLVFNVPYGVYNSGEVVGFEPGRASQLLDLTATIPDGDGKSHRGPLARMVGEAMVEGRKILSEKKFLPFTEKVEITKDHILAGPPKTLEPKGEDEPVEDKPKLFGGHKKHK